jgi:hypothetical protein
MIRFLWVLLACLTVSSASGQYVPMAGGGLGAPSSGGSFVQLKIGGGGFVTNLVISSDGKQFARTDTAGAFVRSSHTATFAPAITQSSMPAGDVSPGLLAGVCAIAISPSNTNHLYMYYTPNTGANGYVYSSTNFGSTWTHTTSQPNSSPICNANDPSNPSYRLNTEYLGVSPGSDSVVYFASPSAGISYTLNAGSTWTAISSGTIPAGSSGQSNLIYFDPSDGTGNTVYITSYGTGIYKCTSATTSPSCAELNTSGMPTTAKALVVDQAGTVWVLSDVLGNTGSLYRYLSGTWSTQVTTGSNQQLACIAINPANSSDVYAIDYHGYMTYSVNAQVGSPTWHGPTTFSETSSVIGWMQWSADGALSIQNCAFDPTQSNVLYGGSGVGVFTTTPPTSGTPNVAWQGDQTVGIENLDLTAGMSLTGGGMGFSAQDRPLWWITNPTVYPSQYYPNNSVEVRYGYNLCGNSTPNTYAGINLTPELDVSTIGPTGTYTASGTSGLPSGFGAGQCIMMTSSNWIWMVSVSSVLEPYFTSNSGSSWGACTFGGGKTAAGGGWVWIAQDTTAPGTVLLYNNGTGASNGAGATGFWKSTSTSSCAFAQVDTTTPDAAAVQLQAVPGEACNFVVASLAYVHGTLPGTGNLYLSQNCGSTWSSAISNVSSVIAFGMGAANPAKDGFPAIYCQCYANDGSGSKFGFFEIDNIDSTPFITNLDTAQGGYPAGNFDFIEFIVGDLATYGTIYGGFGDSGGFYRTLH